MLYSSSFSVALPCNRQGSQLQMNPSGEQANAVKSNVFSSNLMPNGPPITAAIEDTSQRSPDADSGNRPDPGLQSSDADVHSEKAEESIEKTKEQRGWRKVIRNFTPS